MGPSKGSRTINKIIVKGSEYQQQHDDPSSSSKAKQKRRKLSDFDPKWSKDELTNFYEAYRQYGMDWRKISIAIGTKSSDMVQSLFTLHRTFLSLPEHQATAMGFIALVTGHHNASEKTTTHRGYDHVVRASGKARKHGEKPKSIDGPDLPNCQEAKISGFSDLFQSRYYGELVRYIRNHAVRRRTPRIPAIVSADRSTIDEATPGIENVISSTKRKYEAANNDSAIVPTNKYSPDRVSGFAEAHKAGQDHCLLETIGTGHVATCQQHSKKTRIQQTMEEGQTGVVDHETTMASKEGNKPVDLLNNNQLFIDNISEDDMLVLDVLCSLMNAPSKMPKLEINIPSGSVGKTDSTLSQRREEGHPTIDLSKQGKPVGKSSASKTRKKKYKILGAEVPAVAQNVCGNSLALPETLRVVITDDSSLCTDSGRVGIPEASEDIPAEVPSAQTETKPEVRMSGRTRRKSQMHCKTKHMSCNEGSDNLQAKKLLHCLSSEPLRRWCTYEWFYSAVDYPWFSSNEFVHYLDHAKLSHLSRLTIPEWGTIRSSLGIPRRFSNYFLAVEKENLEDYREKVRKIYAQLSDGSRDFLPADLARPFSIGQQVIVRHPNSRELCDGKVVMMGPDCYKVHFDDPDIGVDIVKDTDCMPVNWLYNRPDNMRSCLSNDAYSILEMDHIPDLTASENEDHAVNGSTVLEGLKSLRLTSDRQPKAESIVNSERPPYRSTSDSPAKSRDCPDNNSAGHYDELESYIAAFAERSLSQARQMVDKAMQANSGGSEDEKVCTSNQVAGCAGPGSEPARGAQLPSDLISNGIATVLSIKSLSDSRHPFANVAGVLDHACSMLRPSCPQNLALYDQIKRDIGIIKTQIFALMPTALGNCSPPVPPM
ncbi:Protein ALWAYS EARLY 2 [Zea mays]|uniref:Protein ALWAYS EARLY 2 n=1 Tax=Zea mays TaxID=4577 RepID=A0A3L6DT02_MAIZE|nr:Protein ALWAYS EARLY 2 [Zea mays]